MTQLTFDSTLRKKERRAKVGPRIAAQMIRHLAGVRCWVTRREFKDRLGLNDRLCRLGREWSHGRILRGQDGYKLLRYATPGEIAKASAAWLAQIKAEQSEHARMMRRAHANLHGREQ